MGWLDDEVAPSIASLGVTRRSVALEDMEKLAAGFPALAIEARDA